MPSQDNRRADPPLGAVTPRRDTIAKVLMSLLGLSTVGAFLGAAAAFPSMPADRSIVEAWRMLAYLVFAGLFALLGFFPRRMPGLWELVFLQKAGMTVFVLFFIRSVPGPVSTDLPGTIAAVDGSLAAVTLLCYVLAQGWKAWGRGG